MNEEEKKQLKELLLNAIEAHKQQQAAKLALEQARASFGYAKLYCDEARLINLDGQIWSVTVPFPRGNSTGTIAVESLGDCL
jgi:hypothetical protein